MFQWPYAYSLNYCHTITTITTVFLCINGASVLLLLLLAAQAHELGLPCVICQLHFVIFTLCIYPFHVCKYNVIYNKIIHNGKKRSFIHVGS